MESTKIITYDLCNRGKNYDDLYKYIKSFSSWLHIAESVWIISLEESCKKIRDAIKDILDCVDRIFVAKLDGTSAWRNLLCESEILKKCYSLSLSLLFEDFFKYFIASFKLSKDLFPPCSPK